MLMHEKYAVKNFDIHIINIKSFIKSLENANKNHLVFLVWKC